MCGAAITLDESVIGSRDDFTGTGVPSFTINYDDGDIEYGVPPSRIRVDDASTASSSAAKIAPVSVAEVKDPVTPSELPAQLQVGWWVGWLVGWWMLCWRMCVGRVGCGRPL